ncbi:YdeI family protein [Candidatus Altiarchaeota archaeon]
MSSIPSPNFFAVSRSAWRTWLKKNFDKRDEIYLIFYKKHTGKPCVSYEDAVEEAICYGWIDGKLKRVDDEKHVIRFTPRKSKSMWSEANKQRALKMMRDGKMTEAGRAKIKEAKKNGRWQTAYKIPKKVSPPKDLKDALAKHSKAKENFEKWSPSNKYMYVGWVEGAKKPETRERRIRKVVERAKENKKPGEM